MTQNIKNLRLLTAIFGALDMQFTQDELTHCLEITKDYEGNVMWVVAEVIKFLKDNGTIFDKVALDKMDICSVIHSATKIKQ